MFNLFARHPKECPYHDTPLKPMIPAGQHFCSYCRRHRFLYFKPYEMILIFIGFSLFGSGMLFLTRRYQAYQQELYIQTSVAFSTIAPVTLTVESFTNTPTVTPSPLPTQNPTISVTITFTYTSTKINSPTWTPTLTRTLRPIPTQTRAPTIIRANSAPFVMGTINTPRLNIRSVPDANSFIIFRISQGDSVKVVGRNSNETWVQIDVGIVGWINADYVNTQGDISILPVRSSSSPIPTPSVRLIFSCAGARGPSFDIGDRFTVPLGDGPTSVWTNPNSPPRITRIAEHAGGTILGGPICTGGQEGNLIWWYVQTDQGYYGYVSEGYSHSPVAWIGPDN